MKQVTGGSLDRAPTLRVESDFLHDTNFHPPKLFSSKSCTERQLGSEMDSAQRQFLPRRIFTTEPKRQTATSLACAWVIAQTHTAA